MLQELVSNGKFLLAPAINDGPPSAPAASRVSTRRHGAMGKKDMAVGSVSGTKYPLMSRTRSVSWVAKKHTAPLVPAGRMPATALFRPSELRFEAKGWG